MVRVGWAGLGEVLNKTLNDLGLFENARKYEVFSLWGEIVGDIARHARPRRFQGDVLFVATASSAWSSELAFMQTSILAKINQALGGQYIREVRFSEHLWGAEEAGPGRGSTAARPKQGFRVAEDRVEEATGAWPDKVLGGEIADPSLCRAFLKTAGTMTRRRRYLLAGGYKLCRVCGNVYPRGGRECPACRVKREFVAHNRAIAILESTPEMDDKELSRLIGIPDSYVAERARRVLMSRTTSMIRYRLGGTFGRSAYSVSGKESGRRYTDRAETREELLVLGRKLASLTTRTPYEDLTSEEIERVLGRRLAAILKKG